MRFVVKEDCFLDTKTNLEWVKKDTGKITWYEAMEYDFTKDFRLPTIEELFTLIDFKEYSPASKLRLISEFYWSSTPYASYSDYAWGVGFYYGNVSYNYKSYNHYVRAVRGGEK